MRHTAELIPLLPIIGLGATAVILTLAVAVRRHHGALCLLALVGLAVSFGLIFISAPYAPAQVTSLLIVDTYALFFIGLLLITAAVVALFSWSYLRVCQHHREEHYILLLLATLGTAVLVASNHFVSLFLGLELLNISLYGLIAYVRSRESCIEAGVKYLILASVSSAILVFGMALVYARLGTLEFPAMADLLGRFENTAAVGTSDPVVLAGLALIFVGFGFKLALVPFHMWTPDVYQGAPAPVTAFIATASKGAVMALLLRFATVLPLSRGAPLWLLVALVAGASMFAGNLLALLQRDIKRLLAYSSIAHLGYVLVSFLAGGEAAARAVTFYLIAYTVTTLGAFGVITVLSGNARRTGDLDALEEYRGLGRRHPWLAGVLAAMLLSLAGIPLTAGFMAKFLVLAAGVESALWALAVILVVNSGIGIYYYLRVIVVIYLQPAGEAGPCETDTRAHIAIPPISPAAGVVLAVLVLLLIWLGVYPNQMMLMIQESCRGLF